MIIVATLLIISAVVYIIARALTKYYTENYTDNYPELYVSKGSDEATKCTCNVDSFLCQIHGTSDGKNIIAF
jgi:hypothetical protein